MSRRFLALLMLPALLLSGCSQASQVENHAYVLVMGLDQTQDGDIQMTVQIPRISGNADSQSDTGSSGDYLKLSVSAENYESALEQLDWASPRDMNLSQLKLIVVARDLAQSSAFRSIIKNIAHTERLYTACKVAVCEGSAADFIAAIQPRIGTRISTDIEAMFEHYTARGYVPASSLADLFYQTESIYSDPMVTYALLENTSSNSGAPSDENSQDARTASALSGDIRAVSDRYESDISTRYLGAAVFANGQMQGVFTGTQTVIANLLRNELKSMRYECDGQNLNIVPARPVYIRVDPSADPICISINAKLAISAQEEMPDEATLRASLEGDIRSVIQAAQEMGAEPFGFSEKAVIHFPTIAAWRAYNWHEKFRQAQIQIDLSFAHSDA